MSETAKLAEFIAGVKFEELPGEVVSMAKSCILDYLGALIVGPTTPQGRIMSKLIGELGGKAEATMAGHPQKIPALQAALANGTLSHSPETDDFHVENGLLAGHLGVMTVPPAMAAAELRSAAGREVIAAVVLGYETGVRISRCLGESHYRFWQTTGTIGAFTAAACAGKIMKLDARRMVWALGLAGTQAAGLMHSVGSYAKPLHAGKACQNGFLAARLAEEGYVGPEAILEGKRGYCAATSTDFRLPEITRDLGKSYAILKNSFKRFPCGVYDTVDIAVKVFTEKDIPLAEIEKVTVGTNQTWARTQSNPNPENVTAAKISTEYCVATAMKHKDLTLDHFSPEHLNDPEVRRLMGKIELVVDPEVDRLNNTDHYAVSLAVRMKDGRIHSEFLLDHKGFYQNPLTPAEIEEKFRKLAGRVLPEEKVGRMIREVRSLEKADSLEAVCEILRFPAGAKGGEGR